MDMITPGPLEPRPSAHSMVAGIGIPAGASFRRTPMALKGYRKSAPDQRLLCLDIETVPDMDLLPVGWPEDKMPKPIWHKVVAISVVSARIEKDEFDGPEAYIIEECRSGGDETWDEPTLLRSFWRFFEDQVPRLVTWNGRGFDVPVLRLRSMIYGIPTPGWYQSGDKWSAYHSRYSADWHCDLMEQLADFGATARLGLEELSNAIGFPGKQGEHGSRMDAMIAAGEIQRVRAYCECDTLNTFLAYLRWALASGRATADTYERSVAALSTYLQANSEKTHFNNFLEAWRNSSRPAAVNVPKFRAVNSD